MAFRTQPVDFNFWLARKYALMERDADANSQNAASNAIQANAQAGALGAQAGLDKVRTNLLPNESAAGIAQTYANTANIRNQASVVIPESMARQEGMRADTDYKKAQTVDVVRTGGTPYYSDGPTRHPGWPRSMGGGGYQGFQRWRFGPTIGDDDWSSR